MYIAIILVLLGIAGIFIISGLRNNNSSRIITGVLIGLFTIGFFWFMDFWGDMLWFDALGFNDRFWTYLLAQSITGIVGAFLSLLIVTVLIYSIPSKGKYIKKIAQGLGFIIGGAWGFSNWEVILKFWFREINT
ncbi:MAG: UPF0182 family protein [Ignavibacteriaceae bacterium]